MFDRLDLVCGGNWHAQSDALPEALCPKAGEGEPELLYVRCRLTVFGVTREDVGAGEAPKAARSDAIKRAAVLFGIARALYAMASPWLNKGPGAGQLRTSARDKLRIDERTESHLRAAYARWLREHGTRQFGAPLGHGDEAGAAGFELVEGERHSWAEAAPRGRPRPRTPTRRAERGRGAQPRTSRRRRPTSPSPPSRTPGATCSRRACAPSRAGGRRGRPRRRRSAGSWRTGTGRGGYRQQTVGELARLATGEPIVDRLTRAQVKRVAWLLELAVGGRVRQATLQGSLTRLAKQQREPGEAGELLEQWLRRKYDEVGLLGRREAALEAVSEGVCWTVPSLLGEVT